MDRALPPPAPPPNMQPFIFNPTLQHFSQALYSGRLCKCKPRVSEEASAADGDGDDAEDFPSETAKSFSELIGLCHAWEKDAPRATLALEGALCCLRSLQSGPSKGGSGGKAGKKEGHDEALDGALTALSAAVSRFFGTKRKAGFNSKQVLCRVWVRCVCFVEGGMRFIVRVCRASSLYYVFFMSSVLKAVVIAARTTTSL